ncbi:MAG: pyruvate dehydrogenase (acetyl-transferring) E1 component subunit alpha [Gemmatimonadetes bacterium]|nr:pyruvate dehydrogenase (acetyl-transferring) E1 component subunit alpha [Gemmatimonadota bacterium]MDA1102148.1 pyruvate dehydrogenase (acetyl-transferring) E1 component subunit alpha [Gemmatimonadota bacterium]
MAETKTKVSKNAKKLDALQKHDIGEELALELMRDMLLYRRFEEKVEEAYAIGKIGGFCHLHIGQEGAAAGTIRPLREDDYVMSAYREHTQAIAKGVTPNAVMAELFGRATGASGGKGGSMHVFDAKTRFMGGHGIVGGQVPLATGIAWKIKYRGEDSVIVVYMGDAAVNQGGFHEALNMAAVWQLPIIYVVENNAYGMGTAFSRVSLTDMMTKSAPYGIPAHSVNGQDVLETYAFFRDLVADIRAGAGPQFIDLQTYRFRGHSMSDPVSGTYRSVEEVEKAKIEEDPIALLRDELFRMDILDQDALNQMDEVARRISAESVEFAEASPLPDPSALYEHVWAEVNPNGRLFFDGRDRG